MSADAAEELARYVDLLEPLEKTSTSGPGELPEEEREAWQQAVSNLKRHRGDPIELEEAVATFARALWVAPAWAEPPAQIARALLLRAEAWPESQQDQGRRLAGRFAERALSIDQSSLTARLAAARIKIARGELQQAESIAAVLPTRLPACLALRSEIAAARGDLEQAIELLEVQLEAETEPLEVRDARDKLGQLRFTAGLLHEAVAAHRQNLAEFPDFADGRLHLGQTLRSDGQLLEAFAEIETACVLGLDEARPDLDTLSAELDQRSLVEFQELLKTGRDGDVVDLCPPPAEPPARDHEHAPEAS